MYKTLLIAISLLAPAFAQEATPTDQSRPVIPQENEYGKRPHGNKCEQVVSHMIILEKYDLNKDNKLDESERKALKADLNQVKSELKAKREERKAQKGNKVQNSDDETVDSPDIDSIPSKGHKGGHKGQGPKKGPGAQGGPAHKGGHAMKALVHKLFVEKYDTNKDGKVSKEEQQVALNDFKDWRSSHKDIPQINEDMAPSEETNPEN